MTVIRPAHALCSMLEAQSDPQPEDPYIPSEAGGVRICAQWSLQVCALGLIHEAQVESAYSGRSQPAPEGAI